MTRWSSVASSWNKIHKTHTQREDIYITWHYHDTNININQYSYKHKVKKWLKMKISKHLSMKVCFFYLKFNHHWIIICRKQRKTVQKKFDFLLTWFPFDKHDDDDIDDDDNDDVDDVDEDVDDLIDCFIFLTVEKHRNLAIVLWWWCWWWWPSALLLSQFRCWSWWWWLVRLDKIFLGVQIIFDCDDVFEDDDDDVGCNDVVVDDDDGDDVGEFDAVFQIRILNASNMFVTNTPGSQILNDFLKMEKKQNKNNPNKLEFQKKNKEKMTK